MSTTDTIPFTPTSRHHELIMHHTLKPEGKLGFEIVKESDGVSTMIFTITGGILKNDRRSELSSSYRDERTIRAEIATWTRNDGTTAVKLTGLRAPSNTSTEQGIVAIDAAWVAEWLLNPVFGRRIPRKAREIKRQRAAKKVLKHLTEAFENWIIEAVIVASAAPAGEAL